MCFFLLVVYKVEIYFMGYDIVVLTDVPGRLAKRLFSTKLVAVKKGVVKTKEESGIYICLKMILVFYSFPLFSYFLLNDIYARH